MAKILTLLVLLMTAVTGAWADNYYLVGTMNDWGASKQFLLTQNPSNDAEYMITLTLKADAELKVIGVGENTTWYPDGFDNNYVVNTAGKYTVYFRPDYQGGNGWYCNCIYLEAAPAPDIPVTPTENKNEWTFTMPDYDVELEVEYETELELKEENVNTTVLADWDGYEADITLQRTLVAGSWNTLAVPFNVEATWLAYLKSQYGMKVKLLTSTSISGETIYLNFEDAQTIEAGKPYLVKVTSDFDFSAQAFPGIEVSKDPVPVTTTYADFIPTLGKTTIEGVAKEDVLFVAAENKLKNPAEMTAYMKGFRAYFQLHDAVEARAFKLNLDDDETTGISLTPAPSPKGEGSIYTLDGRRISKATQKGVYIQNGKKVIIK